MINGVVTELRRMIANSDIVCGKRNIAAIVHTNESIDWDCVDDELHHKGYRVHHSQLDDVTVRFEDD